MRDDGDSSIKMFLIDNQRSYLGTFTTGWEITLEQFEGLKRNALTPNQSFAS